MGLVLVGGCQSTQENNTVVHGAADSESISTTLRKKLPYFRNCVEKNSKPATVKEGRFMLNFIINEHGRVSKGRVNSDDYDAYTIGCVGKVLKDTQFVKPLNGGTVQVKVPLNITNWRSE